MLRIQTFLPPGDRYAALLLYGMVLSTCFNGYDAGIMTVILADSQFIEYYGIDDNRSGIVASIPWAATGALLFSSAEGTVFVASGTDRALTNI